MDTQRLILFFIFGFSLLMLWDAWEKEQPAQAGAGGRRRRVRPPCRRRAAA